MRPYVSGRPEEAGGVLMSKLYAPEKLDLRRYQEFENLYKKTKRITAKQILEMKDPIKRREAKYLLAKILLSISQLEEDIRKLENKESLKEAGF
jgi:hypothetical protein